MPCAQSTACRRVLVGVVFVQFTHVPGNATGFASQEIFHCVRELRMSEPMSRIRALRKKAACELVLALRSAFEQCNATRDTKLQRLIVAGFEMQSGDVLVGAPV